QSLFVLSPFLAAGVMMCARLARGLAPAFGAATGLVLYGSMTGALVQLTGGYGPQLLLNNSGRYYDLYYAHQGDLAGGQWLREQARSGDLRAVGLDLFTRSRLFGLPQLGDDLDNFPTEIRVNSFVVLGHAGVIQGAVTVSQAGDQITYRYPVDFLLRVKDLRYSNGTTQIFG
ncbi:MAG: hypothetical protein ACRC0L_04975, partial [Angustibacter sp.]